jgi:hypothetical protein
LKTGFATAATEILDLLAGFGCLQVLSEKSREAANAALSCRL